MLEFIKSFKRGDSYAETVDWLILTAAVMALIGAVYSSLATNNAGTGPTADRPITSHSQKV